MMLDKVFVTGGSGFLGKFLVSELLKRGCLVDSPGSVECDLRYRASLDHYAASKYDVIYHLAAWTQAGDFCLRHQGDQWLLNQMINTNVLDWWHRNQPNARLVFVGTSCAYAEDSDFREASYMLGNPTPSLFTYAMTKRMLFTGAQALAAQYGHKWFCAVPSTLYGPGYHTDGRQMHFIFDLVRKILRGKYFGEDVILWGDGHQRRELVHVTDFIDALLFLTWGSENQIVNIGAGSDFTIREFAIKICRTVGFPFGKISFDESRYVGANSKKLNIGKLEKIYPGYRAKCRDIDDGIQELVAWFEKSGVYRH